MDLKRRDLIKTAALSAAGSAAALVAISLKNEKVVAEESDNSSPEKINIKLRMMPSDQSDQQPEVLNLTLTKVGTVPEAEFDSIDSADAYAASCGCGCQGSGGAGAGSGNFAELQPIDS